MIDFETLCLIAEKNDVPIVSFSLPTIGSVALQDGLDRCFIGMDEAVITNTCDKCVRLAHELGHCATGSFYNIYAARDIRQKHENKADKWAVENTIHVDDLDAAIADGYTEIWSLAEHFGVTEDFMKMVICWYTYGNLSTELYF